MINRLGKDNKPWMPGKKVRVCSKHFVDSEPSKLNPLPTLNLGYESKKLQVGKNFNRLFAVIGKHLI